MENKKITLIQLLGLKEKIHWMRMKCLFGEMDDFGSIVIAYPILVILITICHYSFAIMHFFFESVMFFMNKEQFKSNLKKINESTNRTLKVEFNLVRI